MRGARRASASTRVWSLIPRLCISTGPSPIHTRASNDKSNHPRADTYNRSMRFKVNKEDMLRHLRHHIAERRKSNPRHPART